MQNNLRNNVEFGAQIVIAIAVLVVAGVVVKRHVFPKPANPRNVTRISKGEQLNLHDVDFRQNKKTLVFFLNKDCRYCTLSAPVYRQLTEEAFKQNVKTVAVFPNLPEEAKEYLQSIKLPIADIRTGSLSSYKIDGTPTVLLVNSSGAVEKVWFGDASRREKEIREEFVSLAENHTD